MWEPSCCCCSRKTGCLVLGGLGVTGAILSLLNGIYAFSNLDVYNLADSFCNQYNEDPTCHRIFSNAVVAAFIIHFVIVVICLAVYSMLIHGVTKKISCLMVPAMVLISIKIIFIILVSLLLIALLIVGDVTRNIEMNGGVVFGCTLVFVFIFLVTFLYTYFLLVLRGHYREIRCDAAEDHRILIEEPIPESELLGKKFGY